MCALYRPFLSLQHTEVEVDELQVASGCSVVVPPQLSIEHISHTADTGVYLYTHLRYLTLQYSGTK